MTRTGVAPTLAVLAAFLVPAAGGVIGARAEEPTEILDRRPLLRLDYAPVVVVEGDAGPRQLALACGAQVLRWERTSLGFELDVGAGTTFRSDQAQRDYGAFLVGEYELEGVRGAAAVPFLSAGVGVMHTEVNREEGPPGSDGSVTRTVAPALMAGIGIDMVRGGLGGFHVGLDYLWWQDVGGSGSKLDGNLGGFRLKVGASVPFSWPGER